MLSSLPYVLKVSNATNKHRESLDKLDKLLKKIDKDPEPVGPKFERRLRQLQVTVKSVLADTKITAKPQGAQGTLRDRLADLDSKLEEVAELVLNSNEQIQKAKMEGQEADNKAKKAKEVILNARIALKVGLNYRCYQNRNYTCICIYIQ